MTEVEAFSGEWQELLSRTAAPEIFRSWPWMATWWQVFGDDSGYSGNRQPFVIGVRDGRTVVGLAPFLLRTVPALTLGPGLGRLRRLEFMGSGEDECDEVCSDFLDLYAASGYEDQVAAAVWQRMLAERPRWDEAVFRNVLDTSLLARFVQPMARDDGCGATRRPSGERFWVDLSGGDFNAYVDGLSKKKKKRIFYYRRRLEKEGGFVERRLQERGEIPRFLDEIARLNRLRQGQKGMASAWQSARFREFHALVAPRLWDLGWLDLRLWERDGRSVAALYNFLYEGTIYYYQSGFDTEAFGNVSPGLVTISHVIEWGFNNRQRRYDFLVGAEGSYKEDYACQTEVASDLILYNQSAYGQLLRSARGVKAFLAEARARAQAAQAPAGPQGGGGGEPGGTRDDDEEKAAKEPDLRSV
jgi:CelD/BcsL family acetyltransferase involved in cellulose biosynthesis